MKAWPRMATLSMVFSLGVLVGIVFTLVMIVVALMAASVGSSGPH